MSIASAPAAAKEKAERARVALPVIVEAPAADGTRAFRVGDFWGAQPVRYRSAVSVGQTVPVPEVGTASGFMPGERLVELQATSPGFTGSLYCKSQIRGGKVPPALLCLADRDNDGAFDQLWGSVSASHEFVVPYPEIRSLRKIDPVHFTSIDRAGLGFQVGYYVSGTNPLLGHHQFYAALGKDGKIGHTLFGTHKRVTLRGGGAKAVVLGGGEISVKDMGKGGYEGVVTRGWPTGETMIVDPVPTQTMYISVPG